ncbi:hypothetical protein EJV47_26020 [Hymenobacter gummosus]|uniref:Uncharacterized protein n=1 Tax=Hymenobacter gummosus TaxID=1776032 RepID=A0A3S0J5W2_9BACT|nr:hypothetical protein [Hymenobacter gummosus]RTQ45330.1 hypothetical protein EJV47_26020 [Hymenobacter gummosus]
MDKLFVYLLLASPVLWLVSLLLLMHWRRFWQFFLLNLALLAGYLWVLSSDLISFGHDEYGLKWLFAVLAAMTTHVVLGFGFAVGFRMRRSLGHS